MDVSANPWSWGFLLPALLPVYLMLLWGWRWRRGMTRVRFDAADVMLLTVSGLMLIRAIWGPGVGAFDVDAE
ncbi:MAG: hypothetical protein ACHQ2Z_01095, partial [Elusimicrobiota bacterium]